MRRAAFLTLSDPADFVIDDDLAHEPLRRRGWQVDTVPWDRRRRLAATNCRDCSPGIPESRRRS
jgi:hypothetical protein